MQLYVPLNHASTFCSSSSAKLFADKYQVIDLSNVRADGGVPASYSLFSSSRRTEKIHVVTAFGLLLAILQQRTLEDCPFIPSNYFKASCPQVQMKSV